MRTGLARQDVLQHALAALARTTGLRGKAKQAGARGTNCGDALVEIQTGGRRYLFLAEVKDVRHFATVAMVKEQLACANRGLRPLLVAPYMTRALAEYCRTIQLPFLDTAGNACLEAPGLTVYVTGEPRPADVHDGVRYRAFTLAGMKIVFAMLCRPQLADKTYRDVAKAAGVALGAVGPVIRDLEARGFLVVRTKKALTNMRKLIEEWVTRFPDTLRPKLLPQRYQADADRLLTLNIEAHHGYWGGEMAGQRLTGYLKPERFMLYLENRDKALLVQARMRLDPAGNTEMLHAFWNLPRDEAHPDTVPPLLAYADLMATGEGRNMETARLIYDQFLEAIQGQ
ncbi:MAG TPA: type IV toxin-antitoxin system AbiEi family antitoxin [Bryobacteraceae bacterium]